MPTEVPCPYCAVPYNARGVASHKRYCAMRPAAPFSNYSPPTPEMLCQPSPAGVPQKGVVPPQHTFTVQFSVQAPEARKGSEVATQTDH